MYLSQVALRREERRRERELREYWLEARQQVEAELALAREAADQAIATELCGVLAEFERLLSSAAGAPQSAPIMVAQALAAPVAQAPPPAALAPPAKQTVAAPVAATQAPPAPAAVAKAAPVKPAAAPKPASAAPVKPPEPVQAPAPVAEAPPLTEEQRNELQQQFIEQIDAIESYLMEIDAAGYTTKTGAMDRAQCYRLRIAACRLNTIHARAFEDRLEKQILQAIWIARDKIDDARVRANDRDNCLAFEDQWGGDSLMLDAEEWIDLRLRYERMIPAQEAWEWFENSRATAPQVVQVRVLNAIAAAQQALYKVLLAFHGRDRLQSELYAQLMDAARSTAYLTSLNSETPFDELVELADTIERTLRDAQRESEEFEARRIKDARKKAAIEAMERLFTGHADIGDDPAALAADRETLFPILDECLASGIPPTNVQIRNALVDNGPRLLEGEIKYARILEAVMAERERRGLVAKPVALPDPDSEEEPSDAVVDAEKEVVRLITEGQRILILGGVKRQRVCDELMEILDCQEVVWIDSKKSDKAVKFQTEIKKSNILVLVKNYAGHDMSEKGKEWIKSVGGHFVFLPSGYGVNQIIHQLYTQVAAVKHA
ncbi:MAG TPA: hypothetical protein VKT77_12790 [Chthonomonadaceae bacterium]|nr:hypothetical protein [Chthonomonadaceae bacterium]